MKDELHIFIIWENAQPKKNDILNDIVNKFTIVKIVNIKWDEDNFSENMSRFYGEKLPPKSFKEVECGTGRFTLILILDRDPIYQIRTTSKGSFLVNTKTFDAKEIYRKWTGGGHKIHATNNINETKHDLLILLGRNYNDYINKIKKNIKNNIKESFEDRNIIGCIQWPSLEILFSVLNETTKYVVLRNYEGFPSNYYLDKHGDIDLLVENQKDTAYLLNAKPVSSTKHRAQYMVNINYKTIRFDIRFVGDGYYDERWQRSILKKRVFRNGFYTPSDYDHSYTLLYHALIHKNKVGNDYKEKLKSMGFNEREFHTTLQNFMKKMEYEYTEPYDLSVYYNFNILRKTITPRRALYLFTRNIVNYIKNITHKRLAKKVLHASTKIYKN
jgi:hypothetical protein